MDYSTLSLCCQSGFVHNQHYGQFDIFCFVQYHNENRNVSNRAIPTSRALGLQQ